MDPRQLFPVLCVVFGVLALVSGVRNRHWRGATRTWLLLALIFGAVSVWLHVA